MGEPLEAPAPSSALEYNSAFQYVWKAIRWFSGNALFGIFPLLIMGAVAYLTHGKEGTKEMDSLIYDGGIVLFVSIAIMGAVVVDYLVSGFPASGLSIFAVYIFPFLIMGFISLEFLLVCFNKIDRLALALGSKKSVILMVFSSVYSIATKSTLYLKEDSLQ